MTSLPRGSLLTLSALLLARTAFGATCGGLNQRPCKVWERLPSCDGGLVEDFGKGRCVAKPAPKPIVLPVVLPVIRPAPAPNPVSGTACGGLGQRPCLLWERTPSCDGVLVEDFRSNRCLPPAQVPKGDFERGAQAFMEAHKPALQALVDFSKKVASPELRRFFDNGEFERAAKLQQFTLISQKIGLADFQATLQRIGDAMPKSLLIGVTVEGGVGMGGSIELGVALPLVPGAAARTYRTFGVTMGLITGGSASVSLAFAGARPDDIVGESRGLSAGVGKAVYQGVTVGASVAFWFTPLAQFPGAIGMDFRQLQSVGVAVGFGATLLPVDLRGAAALTQVLDDSRRWRADACGAQGIRPCHVVERVPSCDGGLREDFLKHQCVR